MQLLVQKMSIPTVQSTQPPTEAYRDQFVQLCEWINANADKQIGWPDLANASGWNHNELIGMFNYFLQTTPMTYIRSVRNSRKTKR
jgi:transcriptional regulator GlxA family with amidase domain